MNKTRVALLALSLAATAVAPATATDLLRIRVGTFGSAETSEFLLTEAGLTNHVYYDPRWHPLSQADVWDDASARDVPLMDSTSREIARLDSMDYRFTSQSWSGWFTPNPMEIQSAAFTLRATDEEDIWVSVVMRYQVPSSIDGWPPAMTNWVTGYTSVDDQFAAALNLMDNNSNGVSLFGLLPGSASVQHRYDIASMAFEGVMPATMYNYVMPPNTRGPVDWAGGITNNFRPPAVIDIYSQASFRLSRGDSVGLHLSRGLPAPGFGALLMGLGIHFSRRRR